MKKDEKGESKMKKDEFRDDIKFINKFLYSVQKHKVTMDNWIDSKKRNGIELSKNVYMLYQNIKDQEKSIKKIAKELAIQHLIIERS